MLLNKLFKGAPEIEIGQLSCDSRVPMKNCIFFCIKGIKDDGHDFISEAIKNGATVIVYSKNITINEKAVFIKVDDVDRVLLQVSSAFYDFPAAKLNTYLIAGSYGRSSVSTIINELASNFTECGSIGSFGINYNHQHFFTSASTLRLLDNMRYLHTFVQNGVKLCTFETSALSVSYNKMAGLKPCCLTFTCRGEQASDYREIGRDYFDVFRRFIYSLDDDTCVVLNRDNDIYNSLIYDCDNNVVTYGRHEKSDFQIFDIRLFREGSVFALKYNNKIYNIETTLLGVDNVYNVVAALASLCSTGYEIEKLIPLIPKICRIEGVYEKIANNRKINIIVDCASTLESINKIMEFSRSTTSASRRVISLISINTNDDNNYLDSLAETVQKYSDMIIYSANDTYEGNADNNLEYIANATFKNHLIISDRVTAIQQTIDLATENDTILIIGKGAENYRYENHAKVKYLGDAKVVRNYLSNDY